LKRHKLTKRFDIHMTVWDIDSELDIDCYPKCIRLTKEIGMFHLLLTYAVYVRTRMTRSVIVKSSLYWGHSRDRPSWLMCITQKTTAETVPRTRPLSRPIASSPNSRSSRNFTQLAINNQETNTDMRVTLTLTCVCSPTLWPPGAGEQPHWGGVARLPAMKALYERHCLFNGANGRSYGALN
jgi:hypothetical protein